ncbi:MAG: hypothetical protein ACI9R3_006500 [Verrucomicrobiales bacterium]|jgi:hypothetical protein
MRRIYSTTYEAPSRSKQPSVRHPNAGQIRVGAFFAWIRWFTLIAAIVVAPIAILVKEEWLPHALGLIIAFVVATILFFMFAGGLRCRVCSNPVLLSSRANKSPHAKLFLGLNHGLQVAKDALFTKHFTCMYCGGKVRLSKRPRSEK